MCLGSKGILAVTEKHSNEELHFSFEVKSDVWSLTSY